MKPVQLALLGAGMIGKRHMEQILHADCSELTAIVDPTESTQSLAAGHGTAWYPNFATMLERHRPEAVVIATPTQLHVENGLEAVRAGIAALVEKPLADDVVGATTLVEAAERAGVPLLTGHHRRHNPLVRQAKQAIEAGRLGRIVSVHGMCWFFKPDSYFDVPWRREKGAGPILTNLIHDVDLVRHLCGEVVEVQAVESNLRRGNPVEETAVILLSFASGALGTLSVSDTVSAPWSWEFTSGENPAYTHTPEACYMIGGTEGSLAIPTLDLWRHDGAADWWRPLGRERLPAGLENPLARQIRNLCEVVRGVAEPVVSGREGLQTLRVTAAVKQAAATGHAVRLA